MVHPQLILTQDSDSQLSQFITPIYKTVAGISSNNIHNFILKTIQNLFSQQLNSTLAHIEPLPQQLLDQYQLMPLNLAFNTIHNLSRADYKQGLQVKALERIKLEELISYQLLMLESNSYFSYHIKIDQHLLLSLVNNLPFQLNSSQLTVIQEIIADISNKTYDTKIKQMHRLLQGDVGCGKTIIAFIIAILVIKNNYQVCFMAPTQLLAQQHYVNFIQLFKFVNLTTVLITNKKSKQDLEQLANGNANFIIGTHALIYDQIKFKKLGLVVIDEQHKFGVKQRHSLLLKGQFDKNCYPHLLMLSATPIPRSQALHLYADLNFSTINKAIIGRKKTNTILLNIKRKLELIKFILFHIKNKNKVYWVCPLIDPATNDSSLADTVNVSQWLQQNLPQARVSILHGLLPSEQKQEIMENFINNDIDILLTTTVIETGLDIASANIIIIENADRFGLASIHQLRGRVGRGSSQSYCILLFSDDISIKAKQRLKLIYNTNDGFKIAEADLAMRGHGELIGSKQSGDVHFKLSCWQQEQDQQLLIKARSIALALLSMNSDAIHWYDQLLV